MEQAQEIDLQLCYPAERARPIDDAAVKALAKSIEESGLLNPIIVRKVQKSRAGKTCDAFEVITGMHRVKAFRWLKRATIPAFVVEADDIDAELMLIDENLCRNDLTAAERSSAQPSRSAADRRSPQLPGASARNPKPFHFQRAQGRAFDKAGLRCC